MAISLASLRRGAAPVPPRLLVYGVAGVGKTSLAASAPDPVFLQTEDGLGTIDMPSFGLLRSYADVQDALDALYSGEHGFRTVVLDSLDWLEPLVWQRTAEINGWKDIEQPGYGKGYLAAQDVWRGFLDGMNLLRSDRGMGIILIAHCDIRRFDSPETEPYDRYVIKLQQRAAALVQEHVDAVLFANYRVSTVKTDVGFKKSVTRGVSGGDRLLHTTERPAFLAKNRFGLPDSMPLDWPALAAGIPFYTQQPAAPAAAGDA
ncbi:ATP-binding protein [Roseococcus sp. SDR]|uniref:ATP-binding protein n=1 Tax=Roseococcus sp. SDR TaxID=2835532 RepID=UPI001BCCDF01|nr:ATP-binding protein [Roseococcus sp. SDR]MBS7790281.1 ATP-binding protein [Roseococcus sp. SDR]MBV1845595.1 ATP-binding protein [Roseococcus sp. SDR]